MRILIRVLILSISSLYLNGCTTCNSIVIDTSGKDIWNADIIHRVCGSYSGYSVAIYRTKEGPPSSGEGGKEPFQAMYKTVNHKERPSPINVEWKSNNHLIIHHDTRINFDDNKFKPMIIKAEKTYQNIYIEYKPEPIFWYKPKSNPQKK